jgi:hypothetical protein
MALTEEQQTEVLFKDYLELPYTVPEQSIANEITIKRNNYTLGEQVFIDNIPPNPSFSDANFGDFHNSTSSPTRYQRDTTGVVEKIIEIPLTLIDGTNGKTYTAYETIDGEQVSLLQNSFQFSFGNLRTIPYNYTLYNDGNVIEKTNTTHKYIFDFKTGYITFYGTVPSGPLKLTFVRYCGRIGTNNIKLDGITASNEIITIEPSANYIYSFTDTSGLIIDASSTNDPQIVFEGGDGHTDYHLSVSNDEFSINYHTDDALGTILQMDNENTFIHTNLDVSDNATFNSNVSVSGETSLNSTLDVSDNATFNSNVSVSGILTANSESQIYHTGSISSSDSSLNIRIPVNFTTSDNSYVNITIESYISYQPNQTEKYVYYHLLSNLHTANPPSSDITFTTINSDIIPNDDISSTQYSNWIYSDSAISLVFPITHHGSGDMNYSIMVKYKIHSSEKINISPLTIT